MDIWIDYLKWLVGAIGFAALLVALWLVLSPTAFLLALVARKLRLLVERWIPSAQATWRRRWEAHETALQRARDDIRDDPFVSPESAALTVWRAELETAQQKGADLRDSMNRSIGVVGPLADSLSQVEREAKETAEKILANPTAPTIPEITVLEADTKKHRVAAVHLIFSSTVLLLAGFVNALISSEIFEGMGGIFNANQAAPYVGGIILVVVETGAGFLFAKTTADAKARNRNFTLPQLIFFVGASSVVMLETGLYLIMGGSVTQTLELGVVGNVDAGTVFGLLGFVLAVVIVGFGHILHDSLIAIRTSGTMVVLRQALHRFSRTTQQQLALAKKLSQVQTDIEQQHNVLATLDAPEQAPGAAREMAAALKSMRQVQPPVNRLPNAEIRALEYASYAWCLATVVALIVGTLVWQWLFADTLSLDSPVDYAAGLGATVGVLAVSLCMGRMFFNRGTDARGWLKTIVVIAASVLLGGVAAWYFPGSQEPGAFTVIWVIPCVFLAAVGLQLSYLWAFLPFGVQWMAFIVSSVGHAVWYIPMVLFWASVAILAVVLTGIALPFSKVWKRFTGTDPLDRSEAGS